MENYYLGIDISKKKLDSCLRYQGKDMSYNVIVNNQESIIEFLTSLIDLYDIKSDQLVICAEYTGRYIYPLTCATKNLNLSLFLQDGAKIKYSRGLSRGKNDKTDAHHIATYAQRYIDTLHPYNFAQVDVEELDILISEKDMLIKDRAKYQIQITEHRKYMKSSLNKDKEERLTLVVNSLDKSIKLIEQRIDEIIDHSKVISRQMDLLKSIDGIGKTVALKMIVETQCFTLFENPRKFCCYAGVAPFSYTSGSSQRSKNKISHRADKSIKHLLHMAAISSCTVKEGTLKAYFQRKVKEGKNKMTVINAMRAKLVMIMFAVIKKDTPYSKNYTYKIA
mgnify:CR=1 FL=1